MIQAEQVFKHIFEEHTARQMSKWYAVWNGKIFVNNTARGKKWLYNGKGKVRRAMVEAIEYISYKRMSYSEISSEFEVLSTIGAWSQCHNSLETCRKIEKWLDEQEAAGVLEYKMLTNCE